MAAWMTMNASQNHLWLTVPAALTVEKRRRVRLLMKRNSISGDESSTRVVEEVPKPKGAPPSLISAVNVEKALRGIAITDEDHYGRLGVERGCSSDEVRIAYQNKLLEYLENNDQQQQQSDGLELLKESYGILCTDEERRLYDWSLARKQEDMRYIWPFEVDKIRPLVSSDNAPSLQPPEDHQPTKWLAFFFAAWFFLSIMLFILFNS